MIYLASVYSLNADSKLMDKRAKYARKRTAEFQMEEIPVYSPIAHCHEMSKENNMPRTWDFWSAIDYQFIDACQEFWVLMMPGWEDSVGITAEIKYATDTHKNVIYIKCDDYQE